MMYTTFVGIDVFTLHFGYQPPPPLSTMSSLQTLQEIAVPHVAKSQSYTKHETL
jgi:hypothetical protein